MSRRTRGRRALLLTSAAALVLAVAMVFALVSAWLERSYLEELRDSQALSEAGRVTTAPTPGTTLPPVSARHGFRLLHEGRNIDLYYFGGAAFYGKGIPNPGGEETGLSLPSYRTFFTESLRAHFSLSLTGWTCPAVPGLPSLSEQSPPALAAAYLDLSVLVGNGADPRLMLLAPDRENLTAELPYHVNGFRGDARRDLEFFLRSVREMLPLCDIVLAVPYNATEEEAEAFLALGAHYGLLTVDLRPIFEDPSLLVTEGSAAGFPNEQGHRALADALFSAVREAAEAPTEMPPLPRETLYS